MNNTIYGKRCTVLWHADDLMISHADSVVISIVLADIDVEYERISKMTTTQGKVYK